MKETFRRVLELSPRIYVEALRFRRRGHWSRKWVVTRRTDCVVEGFQRSANSFAHQALVRSQKGTSHAQLRTATHTHSPAQVLQAISWRIPTLVCIRVPTDAVAAWLAFRRELSIRNTGHALPFDLREAARMIKRWLWFYRQVKPVASELYLAPFERIIREYDSVSQEFIERFDLPLRPWNEKLVPTSEILNRSFHVGPDEERDQIKEEMRRGLMRVELRDLLGKADRLYAEVASEAEGGS